MLKGQTHCSLSEMLYKYHLSPFGLWPHLALPFLSLVFSLDGLNIGENRIFETPTFKELSNFQRTFKEKQSCLFEKISKIEELAKIP